MVLQERRVHTIKFTLAFLYFIVLSLNIGSNGPFLLPMYCA